MTHLDRVLPTLYHLTWFTVHNCVAISHSKYFSNLQNLYLKHPMSRGERLKNPDILKEIVSVDYIHVLNLVRQCLFTRKGDPLVRVIAISLDIFTIDVLENVGFRFMVAGSPVVKRFHQRVKFAATCAHIKGPSYRRLD